MSEIGQSGLKKPATLIALGQNMSGGTPAFDPAYQAVLDYAISQGFTLPSIENQMTQNSLFQGQLRSASMWDDIFIFYNFFNDSPDPNFAKINWKAPGTFQCIGTGHEPTWTPLSGFKGNGVDQYLNTQYAPSLTGLTPLDQTFMTNFSAFTDVETQGVVVSPGCVFGTSTGGQFFIALTPKFNATQAAMNTNNSSNSLIPNPNNGAFIQIQRTGTSVEAGIVDGVKTPGSTALVATWSTNPFWIGCLNYDNTVLQPVPYTYKCFGFAKSLAGKEVELYESWNDYVHTTIAVLAYKKITDYATLQGYVLPSDAQQLDQKRLISLLSRAGAWNEFDIFYNFLTDGDHNFAKINWKNPGTFQAVGTGHEPTFTPNVGFTSVLNSYLDTTWNPAVNAVKSSLNSILLSISAINPTIGLLYHGNQVVPNRININLQGALANQVYAMINTTGGPHGATNPVFDSAPGLYQFWREDATVGGTKAKKAASAEITMGSDVSTAIPSATLFILAYNNSGAPITGNTGLTVNQFAVASKMDAGKRAGFNTAWKTYHDKYYVPPHPYEAVLSYAAAQGFTPPSAPQQTTQRQLITDLMAIGVWDLLDVFYNFVTDGDFAFSRINWKNPGTFQGVVKGAPVFTVNEGVKNVGGLGAVETIAPSECVKMTINSASHFYDYVQRGPSVQHHGAYNTSSGVGIIKTGTNVYLNNSSSGIGAPGSGLMHADFSFGGGIGFRMFRDGANIGSNVNYPTGALIPYRLWACQRNDSNTAGPQDQDNIFGCFALGASLVGKEVALTNAWLKYKNPWYAKSAYAKIIAYATSQAFVLPSAPQQVAQEQLILGLMNARVWDELDVFYNFVTDGDHNFAKINWKTPGTFQAVGTGHEPLFTINDGFKGNGTTQYLNTTFINSTSVKGQAGNVSLFAEVSGFSADGGTAIGVGATVLQLELKPFFPGALGTRYLAWGSGAVVTPPDIATGDAFAHIQSFSSTQQKRSTNGVPGATTAMTAGIDAANPIFLFAANGGGLTPFAFGNGTLRCFGSGTSLNGKELALYNAWKAYIAPYAHLYAYQAILNYAAFIGAVAPSAPVQAKGKQLIRDLMDAGVWDEMDLFYNFYTDGDRNFAKVNWKNPGTFQAQEFNTPTFAVNVGFIGTNFSHLSTGFVPSVNSVKNSQNNVWLAHDVGGGIVGNDNHFHGVTNGPSELSWCFQGAAVNQLYMRIYASGSAGNINPIFDTAPGLYQFWRDSATEQKVQKENSIEFAQSAPSVAPPNIAIYLLAYNSGGSTAGADAQTIRCFALGSALNTAKRTAFRTAWNTYKI